MDAQVIAVISGKGGVGKTTCSANLSIGFAKLGKKVLVIDFDIGQRNLDMILGVENRIIYDSSHVMSGEVKPSKATIKTKFSDNLEFLPASQADDKTSLKSENVKAMLDSYKESFDFIILDAPAGIESGFSHSVEFADVVITVINPEVSSIRDADRAIGLLDKATILGEDVQKFIIVNRTNVDRVNSGELLSEEDVVQLVEVESLGQIPDDRLVIEASNTGIPTIENQKSPSGKAFFQLAKNFLGDDAVVSSFIESSEKDLKTKGIISKIKEFLSGWSTND